MKRKFSKILGIGLALALLTSMLVTATPVAAEPVTTDAAYSFTVVETGTAAWVTTEKTLGEYSVELALGDGVNDAARVVIPTPADTLLSDISTISFWWECLAKDPAQTYIAPPYATFEVDTTGNGEVDQWVVNFVALELDNCIYAESVVWTERTLPTDNDHWAIFGTDQQGVTPETAITWAEVQTAAGTGTVLNYKVAIGEGSEASPWPVETVYIDDVTINETTYVLEPRVINSDTSKGFNTIQDAIDDADTDAGDTITVAAGTYVENVDVNKQLTLTGDTATPSNVVIGAGDSNPAITLSADGIILEGFKATGVTCGSQGGIAVNSNGNTVRHNEVTGNKWVGIQLNNDTHLNTIEYNTVIRNGHHGICLLGGSHNNTIQHNTCSENRCDLYGDSCGCPASPGGIGIYLYEHNTYNTITNNIASANYHDGICLHDQSSYNTITGNTANDSVWCNGIGIRNPSGGGKITGNIITGNTANGNNENGIAVGDSEKTTIRDNTASNNVKYEGIRLTNSDGNTITGNTANNNGRDGIRLGGGEGSDNNTITGNTASNNIVTWNAAGITVQETSANNTVTGNTLTNNQEGILIRSSAGTGNTAHFNNIYDNVRYGIESGVTVDATLNWFGDISGPEHTAASFELWPNNPGGIGNTVSDNVDYAPWLTRPFETVMTDNIAYFGLPMVWLDTGWNTLSTPIALDPGDTIDGVTYPGCNTWGKYKALGDTLNVVEGVVNAYWYDANDADDDGAIWEIVNDDYELKPCDAIYVRMAEPDIAAILLSRKVSVPSRDLYAGWNLVSLALWPESEDLEGCCMPVTEALDTVYTVTGDYTGYKLVVSPPVNWEQWSFWRDSEAGVDGADMELCMDACIMDDGGLPPELADCLSECSWRTDCLEKCMELCTRLGSGDLEWCLEECMEECCCRECCTEYCTIPLPGMYITQGYWVFMINDGTLAGFSQTPMPLGMPAP